MGLCFNLPNRFAAARLGIYLQVTEERTSPNSRGKDSVCEGDNCRLTPFLDTRFRDSSGTTEKSCLASQIWAAGAKRFVLTCQV